MDAMLCQIFGRQIVREKIKWSYDQGRKVATEVVRISEDDGQRSQSGGYNRQK